MENIKLQPGDYTTQGEINSYADREGLTLRGAYKQILAAFVEAGADSGEGVYFAGDPGLPIYGWPKERGKVYFSTEVIHDHFSRHLTPEQILGEGKQEDLHHEEQSEKAAPKQIGVPPLASQPRDLQSIISDYLWLLDSIEDPFARDTIKLQLTGLIDLQCKQLKGDNDE